MSDTITSNIPTGVSDYSAALLRLLPKGSIWPTITDYNSNIFVRLLAGLADEPERVDTVIQQIFLEAIFPDSTDTTFLTDWETLLGLPLVANTKSDDDRRKMVLAMLNLSPLSNEDFFTGLANLCGYTINITYGTDYYARFEVSDASAHEEGKLDSMGQQIMVGEAGNVLTWEVHVTAMPDGGSFEEITAIIQKYQPCYCAVSFTDET